MKALLATLVIAVSFAAAVPASAADPATIMGKWIERFKNGKGMVSEFTPTSIAYYPVDETGKALGEPKKALVTYKDLGGEDIAIVFPRDANGGIMVHRRSADAVTLDFPGMAARELTRLPEN